MAQAAKRHGVEIPHLCYKEGLRPDGNCRACMVEIKGERAKRGPDDPTAVYNNMDDEMWKAHER